MQKKGIAKHIFLTGCCLAFGCTETLLAQQRSVLVNLRAGLLNYDMGAEVKLGNKHSIYPFAGFGHTIVYYSERHFLHDRPEADPWWNFGYMSLHVGLEYRFYPMSITDAERGYLNKGFFAGIKFKYNLPQNFTPDKDKYSYDANLKIGAGVGYQDKIGKNGNVGYELIAYPGVIINNDFSYAEINSFCGIKLLFPLFKTRHS